MQIPDIKVWSIVVGSMQDYPGYPSIVLFTKGCNMSCSYCHNLEAMKGADVHTPSYVLNILKQTPLCDALVITGGEPCLQPLLVDFLYYLKGNFKYKVKLDTNGTFPLKLKKILDEHLIDFVAMDIKTKSSEYKSLGYEGASERIEQSIELIKNSGIPYQFRTTLYPNISKESVDWIKNKFSENEIKFQVYRNS